MMHVQWNGKKRLPLPVVNALSHRVFFSDLFFSQDINTFDFPK